MNDEPLLNNEEAQPGNFGPVLGALTVAAAGVLYCVTRHPLLAAILPWLHGGWKTFHTGLWILRTDPVRSRAGTCFAFYLAAACWKAAAAAFATVYLLVIVTKSGIQPDETEFLALCLALLAGLLLNSLIGVAAVVAALVCKVRVCVQSDLRTAMHGDLSAAVLFGPRRNSTNLGFIVVATAVVFPLAIAGAIVFAIVTWDRNANAAVNTVEVVVGLFASFAVPLAAIPLLGWLSSRIIARSPQECWPPGTCSPRSDESKSS